nr:macro domain-containing protein [Bergeyella cardium]
MELSTKQEGRKSLRNVKKIRNRQGGCKVGEAVITISGKLPAKFVIHTVGSVWNNGKDNEAQLLYSAYLNCLNLAIENDVRTIAFPNISTGVYKFPKEQAARIAIKAVNDF